MMGYLMRVNGWINHNEHSYRPVLRVMVEQPEDGYFMRCRRKQTTADQGGNIKIIIRGMLGVAWEKGYRFAKPIAILAN